MEPKPSNRAGVMKYHVDEISVQDNKKKPNAGRTAMANSSRHSGTVPHVDYIKNLAEFYSLIASTSSKPMIVDFTATWCPTCKRIGPIFVAMSGEAENAGWTFRKVDVDEANDVAQVAKINCMPTFKVYKNGAEVAELEGANE